MATLQPSRFGSNASQPKRRFGTILSTNVHRTPTSSSKQLNHKRVKVKKPLRRSTTKRRTPDRQRNYKTVAFLPGPVGLQLEPVTHHNSQHGKAEEGAKVVRFVDGGPMNPGQARKSGAIQPGDLVIRADSAYGFGTTYDDIIAILQKSHMARELRIQSVWEDAAEESFRSEATENASNLESSYEERETSSQKSNRSLVSSRDVVPTKSKNRLAKVKDIQRTPLAQAEYNLRRDPKTPYYLAKMPKKQRNDALNMYTAPAGQMLDYLADLSQEQTEPEPSTPSERLQNGPIIVPIDTSLSYDSQQQLPISNNTKPRQQPREKKEPSPSTKSVTTKSSNKPRTKAVRTSASPRTPAKGGERRVAIVKKTPTAPTSRFQVNTPPSPLDKTPAKQSVTFSPEEEVSPLRTDAFSPANIKRLSTTPRAETKRPLARMLEAMYDNLNPLSTKSTSLSFFGNGTKQNEDSGEFSLSMASSEDDVLQTKENKKRVLQELGHAKATLDTQETSRQEIQSTVDELFRENVILRQNFQKRIRQARKEHSKTERKLKDLYSAMLEQREQRIQELNTANEELKTDLRQSQDRFFSDIGQEIRALQGEHGVMEQQDTAKKSLTFADPVPQSVQLQEENSKWKEEAAELRMQLEMSQTLVREMEGQLLVQTKDSEVETLRSELRHLKTEYRTVEGQLQHANQQLRNAMEKEDLTRVPAVTDQEVAELKSSLQQAQESLAKQAMLADRNQKDKDTLAIDLENVNAELSKLKTNHQKMEEKLQEKEEALKEARKEVTLANDALAEQLESQQVALQESNNAEMQKIQTELNETLVAKENAEEKLQRSLECSFVCLKEIQVLETEKEGLKEECENFREQATKLAEELDQAQSQLVQMGASIEKRDSEKDTQQIEQERLADLVAEQETRVQELTEKLEESNLGYTILLKTHTEMTRERSDLEQRNQALSEQLVHTRETVDSLRRANVVMEQEGVVLASHAESRKRDLESLQSEQAQWKADQDALQAELDSAMVEIDALNTRVAEEDTEKLALQAELETATQQLNQVQQDKDETNGALEAELQGARTEIESLRSSSADAENDKRCMEMELEVARSEIGSYQEKQQQMEERLASLAKALSEQEQTAQATVSDEQDKVHALHQQVSDLSSTNERLTEEKELVSKSMEHLKEELSLKNQRLAQQKEELARLQSSHEDALAMQTKSQKDLASMSSDLATLELQVQRASLSNEILERRRDELEAWSERDSHTIHSLESTIQALMDKNAAILHERASAQSAEFQNHIRAADQAIYAAVKAREEMEQRYTSLLQQSQADKEGHAAHVRQLEEENQAMNLRLKESESNLASVDEVLASTSAQFLGLEATLRASGGTITELTAQLQVVHEKKVALESQVSDLNQLNAQLTSEVETARKNGHTLEHEFESSNQQVLHLEQKLADGQKDLEKTRATLLQTEASLRQATNEQKEAVIALEKAQEELERSKGTKSEMDRSNTELVAQVDGVQRELFKSQKSSVVMEVKCRGMTREMQGLERQMLMSRQELQRAEESMRNIALEKKELLSESTRVRDLLTLGTQEKEALESRATQLGETLKEKDMALESWELRAKKNAVLVELQRNNASEELLALGEKVTGLTEDLAETRKRWQDAEEALAQTSDLVAKDSDEATELEKEIKLLKEQSSILEMMNETMFAEINSVKREVFLERQKCLKARCERDIVLRGQESSKKVTEKSLETEMRKNRFLEDQYSSLLESSQEDKEKAKGAIEGLARVLKETNSKAKTQRRKLEARVKGLIKDLLYANARIVGLKSHLRTIPEELDVADIAETTSMDHEKLVMRTAHLTMSQSKARVEASVMKANVDTLEKEKRKLEEEIAKLREKAANFSPTSATTNPRPETENDANNQIVLLKDILSSALAADDENGWFKACVQLAFLKEELHEYKNDLKIILSSLLADLQRQHPNGPAILKTVERLTSLACIVEAKEPSLVSAALPDSGVTKRFKKQEKSKRRRVPAEEKSTKEESAADASKKAGAAMLNNVFQQKDKMHKAKALRKWYSRTVAAKATSNQKEAALALSNELKTTKKKLGTLKSHLLQRNMKKKSQAESKPRLRSVLMTRRQANV